MVRTIQNKMFWKLMLKRQSPDINAINVNYEMFKKSVNEFETYFLGTKDFVGGTDLNISGAQSFITFLMADFHKNLNKVILHHMYISRCLNGTFP